MQIVTVADAWASSAIEGVSMSERMLRELAGQGGRDEATRSAAACARATAEAWRADSPRPTASTEAMTRAGSACCGRRMAVRRRGQNVRIANRYGETVYLPAGSPTHPVDAQPDEQAGREGPGHEHQGHEDRGMMRLHGRAKSGR